MFRGSGPSLRASTRAENADAHALCPSRSPPDCRRDRQCRSDPKRLCHDRVCRVSSSARTCASARSCRDTSGSLRAFRRAQMTRDPRRGREKRFPPQRHKGTEREQEGTTDEHGYTQIGTAYFLSVKICVYLWSMLLLSLCLCGRFCVKKSTLTEQMLLA